MPEVSQIIKDKKQESNQYKKYALPAAIGVLVIFYIVGFWGLMFSGKPTTFQNLTPMNLMLTNALLFAFHKSWSKSFFLFAGIVFCVGYLSEVVGVHTGMLFGDYSYGHALGLKVWDVPLLIGLNWLMLVYVTGCISNYTNWHWVVKALLAATLMVMLDFFIEPVAMHFDFWSWRGSQIPFSNYVGWFAVAFALQLYFQKAVFVKRNLMAPYVFVVQLLFFIGISSLL